VRDHAVEHFSILLVGVEVEVNEVPQVAAALRDAEAVDPRDDRLAVGGAKRISLAVVVGIPGTS
jgi:hypothetical protein